MRVSVSFACVCLGACVRVSPCVCFRPQAIHHLHQIRRRILTHYRRSTLQTHLHLVIYYYCQVLPEKICHKTKLSTTPKRCCTLPFLKNCINRCTAACFIKTTTLIIYYLFAIRLSSYLETCLIISLLSAVYVLLEL